MLYLRYATERPDPLNRPPAVLSMRLVSEIMQEKPETLKWLDRKYFTQHQQQRKNPEPETKVTVRNVTEDEMLFLTDQDTLYSQATMSLERRCVMFHRQFPWRRIKPGVLRKIYSQFGITRKKVEVSCVPNRMEARMHEFANTTVELDNKIDEILKAGHHLVYIDEAVFKQRDF